jgi:hypothetical protein
MSWREVPIWTWIAMMLSVIAALSILRGFTGPIDSTHQSRASSPYSVSTGDLSWVPSYRIDRPSIPGPIDASRIPKSE